MFQCSVLCDELHDDLQQLIHDTMQETKGLMPEHDVKCAIFEIVGAEIDLTDVKSVEINAGSNYIELANGETWFIMVSKCEEEEV